MKSSCAVFSFLVLSLASLPTLSAATIMKLDLGTSGPDVALIGNILSTIDDGDASTAGAQNTNLNFTGLLDPVIDIVGETASISLDGVALHGLPTVVSGIVVQPTMGGTVRVWDALNTLLLEANLQLGSIVGPLGNAATGSFTNLNLGSITGGSLASYFVPDSYSIALAFTDIHGGAGFAMSGNELNEFQAAATANIDAVQVPEPETGVLLAACVTLGLLASRFTRTAE